MSNQVAITFTLPSMQVALSGKVYEIKRSEMQHHFPDLYDYLSARAVRVYLDEAAGVAICHKKGGATETSMDNEMVQSILARKQDILDTLNLLEHTQNTGAVVDWLVKEWK